MGGKCPSFCELVVDNYEIQRAKTFKKIEILENENILEKLDSLKIMESKEDELRKYRIYRNSIKEVNSDIAILDKMLEEQKAHPQKDPDLQAKEFHLDRFKKIMKNYNTLIERKDLEIKNLK